MHQPGSRYAWANLHRGRTGERGLRSTLAAILERRDRAMKIAAVMAHPDYVATTIGGTVALHARDGDDVFALVLSPGELGPGTILYPDVPREDVIEIRLRELEDFAQSQGLRSITVLRYPDTEIRNSPEIRLDIAMWLRDVRPDVLLTHWPNDAHPDVRETGQAAADACLISLLSHVHPDVPPHGVVKVFAFPIRTSIAFAPDTFVDISGVADLKLSGVERLATVRDELRLVSGDGAEPDRWRERVVGPDLYWGQLAGVRFCEPFRSLQQPEGRRAVSRLPA